VENNHVPKSSFYFLSKFRRQGIFADGEFSPTLNQVSKRTLYPLPTVPFPGGVIGKKFRRKSSASPNFDPRDGLPRTKYNARTKYSAFWFRRKKNTLRIKVQHWFFYRRSTNVSPLGISKKIGKIYFGFWLISFCLPKTGFSRIFATRQMEAAANNFCRFEKSNLKGHWHSYLW
jgi:hypothetical protein